MITIDLENREDSAYRQISSQISIIGYYTIDYTHFSLSLSSFFFFRSVLDVCVGKCLPWLEHMVSGKCSFFLITTLFLFLPLRMCSVEMKKKKLLGERKNNNFHSRRSIVCHLLTSLYSVPSVRICLRHVITSRFHLVFFSFFFSFFSAPSIYSTDKFFLVKLTETTK